MLRSVRPFQFLKAETVIPPKCIGGYDHTFVGTPHDRYICNICHLPSRVPYLSVCCGHIFCKSCLDNAKKAAAVTNACPVCRSKNFETFPNKQLDREINNLHIYCTNKDRGCKWEGELNGINNHLGNCQFEEVKCSNECGKMMQRQYLTSHLRNRCPCRKVNCQYCHDTGEHQFIEGQHKEECPKLPLPCPNKCEVGSVPREDMEAHRKECPLEVIQCEFYSVGCKRGKLARKDLEEHDNEYMKEHLMMTIHELSHTKSQLAASLKQTANLTAVLMNAQLGPNTVANHVNIRSVHLDSMATLFKSGNQECPVIIKMTEYNAKRRAKSVWYSDPFYTNNKGYKMYLRVDTAGQDAKGTHLSVYLYLMKGPHDDKLAWPLRGKFEIKLLNQISDSGHHSVTLTYDDKITGGGDKRVTGDETEVGWGWNKYISNEDLNKVTLACQLIKDDCLFFRVTKF